MAGVVTNPRVVVSSLIGLDWQTAEDAAVPGTPYTPTQFIVAQVFNRNPDPSYIHPNGTHGSIFKRKDGDRIVAQAFKKEIKFWGGRLQVLPFLESVTGGQPTIAFADLTLSGAVAGTISALSFIGARPHHNTSHYTSVPPASPTFYLRKTGAGFPVTFEVFKDSARTQLVANANVTAGATPTALVAQNNSGLTGSVTLSAAGSGDAEALITKIKYPFANQHARYFRLFYTDGQESIALSDCIVESLKFESQENGALEVTAAIMAKRRTITDAVTFSPQETRMDLVPYSHSELTLTRDPSGSPVTPAVDAHEFTIKNNVLQYVANQATPQKLIKRGWVELAGNMKGEFSNELKGILDQARANTVPGAGFFRMQMAYLLSGRTMLFDMQQVKPTLKEPGIAEELVEKIDLDYEAYYDGVTPPVEISVMV